MFCWNLLWLSGNMQWTYIKILLGVAITQYNIHHSQQYFGDVIDDNQQQAPRGLSQYQEAIYRYKNPHYKDKTVSWCLIFTTKIPIPEKTVLILRWGPVYHFKISIQCDAIVTKTTQIAKFMAPTWGPPGSCWPQMGPMLAPWTLLSGNFLQNTTDKHSIAHIQGHIMGCFLWVKSMIHVLPWVQVIYFPIHPSV